MKLKKLSFLFLLFTSLIHGQFEKAPSPCNGNITPIINITSTMWPIAGEDYCQLTISFENASDFGNMNYYWHIDGQHAPFNDNSNITMWSPNNSTSVELFVGLDGGCSYVSTLIMDCENYLPCPDCDDTLGLIFDETNTNSIITQITPAGELCNNTLNFSNLNQLDDCVSFTINFGDGTSSSTLDNTSIDFTKTYPNINSTYNLTINVVLNNGETCSTQSTIIVNCENTEPCTENICDYDTLINIENNGCDYTLSSNINDLIPCNDDYVVFRWDIKSPSGILYTFNTPTVNLNAGFFTEFGDYKIALAWYYFDGNGFNFCKNTKYTKYGFPCSKTQDTPQTSLRLSPNPSKQNSVLNFEGIDYKDIQSIQILDVFGNLKQVIIPKDNSFKLNKFNSGIYFVQFRSKENEIIKKKLIIE